MDSCSPFLYTRYYAYSISSPFCPVFITIAVVSVLEKRPSRDGSVHVSVGLQGSSSLWVWAFWQDRSVWYSSDWCILPSAFKADGKEYRCKVWGTVLSARRKEETPALAWLPCAAKLLLLLRQQREMSAVREKGAEICLHDWRQVGERKKRNWFQERCGSSHWPRREGGEGNSAYVHAYRVTSNSFLEKTRSCSTELTMQQSSLRTRQYCVG